MSADPRGRVLAHLADHNDPPDTRRAATPAAEKLVSLARLVIGWLERAGPAADQADRPAAADAGPAPAAPRRK